MTGETAPARSLNGSSASIEASSITHTPACGERWRPGLRRTVGWLVTRITRRLARRVAERQGGDGLSLRDPAHRAGAQHGGRTGVGGGPVLDLGDEAGVGLGGDELLLERLPVDRVVDVT